MADLFGGQGDLISTIVWFILFTVLIFIGPRLMVTQTVFKLEKDVAELESIAERARGFIINKTAKSPRRSIKEEIRNFMEFFAVPPVDIDPYGLTKKLDHVIRNSDVKFRMFVDRIAPNFSENAKMDLRNALAGAIQTHQIAKIVRHFLELIKKYKMFQMALILQMQLPLIMRVSRASLYATKAFVDEVPIGDGIGPFVASSMIKGKAKVYKEDEFVVAKEKVGNRTVFISKSYGPGASTGYPGKFLLKFFKKQRINRIITIDAALRLEGERSGTVSEGVGVAMGGSGVDRYEIEEIATRMNIPLDAVAIKVSDEEALMPMKKEVMNSVDGAIGVVKSILERTRKSERILIMGVGNTCGVGNNRKSLEESRKKILKASKTKEKERKKGIMEKLMDI